MSILNPSQTSPPQLTSLPREIRDRIYQELLCIYQELVSIHKSIRVERNDDRNGVQIDLYQITGRTDRSPESFLEAVDGSAIASEVYQEFFRTNRFYMFPYMLPAFLYNLPTVLPGSSKISFSKNGVVDKTPWIRSLEIGEMHRPPAVSNYKYLALISRCTGLKTLKFRIYGDRTSTVGRPDVYLKVEHLASIISRVRKQIKGGLTVEVRSWGTPEVTYEGTFETDFADITWMWDEPTEEMKKRVENGLGSHRDCIKVLMSTGWKYQEGALGEWADHWIKDHDERKAMRSGKKT